MVHNRSSQGAWTVSADSHQQYRELCALSAAGELTAEEWSRLTKHLAGCSACRHLKERYERVVGLAMSALAAEAQQNSDEEGAQGSWSIDEAEARLLESLRNEPASSCIDSTPRLEFPKQRRVRRYAVAAMLFVACSVGGYLIGTLRAKGSAVINVPSRESAAQMAPGLAQPADQPTPNQSRPIKSEQDQVAKLLGEVRKSRMNSARLTDQLHQLEDQLAQRSADLDRSLQDRADLSRQLAQAQAASRSLETRLTTMSNKSLQDTAQSLGYKAQIEELNVAAEIKDTEIAQQQELLQHDRDIRNLIGARNLYIAEIYDVAKTGDTQKPFGRVFYTKDKSLVFYGYDLDQRHGLKKETAFQVWGRCGTDRDHDVSLGLLYRDDSNQKRWVLKYNDTRTIAKIDAVFVTVEPEGGSKRPTSKPMLIADLRLEPNHP